MTRRSYPWLRSLAGAVMLTALVEACAPAGRGVMRHTALAPAPMCEATTGAPGSLHWAAKAGGAARRLAVRLDVLPEASVTWRLEGRARMDEALAAWNRAGVPVRLARAEPADTVAIRVTVMRRLPLDPADRAHAYRAGVTHLRYDDSGAIRSAQVLVAEETPRGAPYSVRDQLATLTHELGHALGIPHSDHPFALMSARTVALSLTPHDVALARAVYDRRACGDAAPVTASRNE